VLREYRNDLIRQRVFAADVGEGASHGCREN
jgi:hypothetical protein